MTHSTRHVQLQGLLLLALLLLPGLQCSLQRQNTSSLLQISFLGVGQHVALLVCLSAQLLDLSGSLPSQRDIC